MDLPKSSHANMSRRPSNIETIGNFDVDKSKLLGRGGFAEVFYGREKGTGREVAAKMVFMKDSNRTSMTEAEQEVR